ncbi:MAG: hypothetical protein RJA99_3168 [Pseudomonadota bacterium]
MNKRTTCFNVTADYIEELQDAIRVSGYGMGRDHDEDNETDGMEIFLSDDGLEEVRAFDMYHPEKEWDTKTIAVDLSVGRAWIGVDADPERAAEALRIGSAKATIEDSIYETRNLQPSGFEGEPAFRVLWSDGDGEVVLSEAGTEEAAINDARIEIVKNMFIDAANNGRMDEVDEGWIEVYDLKANTSKKLNCPFKFAEGRYN